MSKPTIFFSHSSHDRKLLATLKELFRSKTGKAIDVFVSSDGQSIPVGRNWVHSVERGLDTAGLMVVFVTPTSIHSNWLYFESGYAYAKGKRVVPVGLLGVDLSTLKPPLSLLQGFNVTSEAGLNNIIAIVNQEFQHEHGESFTAEEFHNLTAASGVRNDAQLGEHALALDKIVLDLQVDSFSDVTQAVTKLHEFLVSQGEDVAVSDTGIDLMGIEFRFWQATDRMQLTVNIDARVSDLGLPRAVHAIRLFSNRGLKGTRLRAEFTRDITFVQDRHKLTGRLYGTSVTFGQDKRFRYKSLEFGLGRTVHATASGAPAHGATFLAINVQEDELQNSLLRELLDLLFDREVLFSTS